jgi:hypothetical protein
VKPKTGLARLRSKRFGKAYRRCEIKEPDVNKYVRLATGVTAATLASGCATTGTVEEVASPAPEFRLEEYFLGRTIAYGHFEDRFGKLRRHFRVEMTGTMQDGVLILDERFVYDDGQRQTRIWHVTPLADGRYEGTAADVDGIATGKAVGNTFNWRYKVDLSVNGAIWKVGFDDWMYLLADDVVMNRAYVTRWGIRIGEATITFVKPDAGEPTPELVP